MQHTLRFLGMVRRRIHECHMRRRIHACHMRRRIHTWEGAQPPIAGWLPVSHKVSPKPAMQRTRTLTRKNLRTSGSRCSRIRVSGLNAKLPPPPPPVSGPILWKTGGGVGVNTERCLSLKMALSVLKIVAAYLDLSLHNPPTSPPPPPSPPPPALDTPHALTPPPPPPPPVPPSAAAGGLGRREALLEEKYFSASIFAFCASARASARRSNFIKIVARLL
jgi:hypothetical protein